MKVNSYNFENPIEAKILLLLGLCGGDLNEFSFESRNNLYGKDEKRRILHWDYKPIDKSALDYVKTILFWEDNYIVEFKPTMEESVLNRALWSYEIRLYKKDLVELNSEDDKEMFKLQKDKGFK